MTTFYCGVSCQDADYDTHLIGARGKREKFPTRKMSTRRKPVPIDVPKFGPENGPIFDAKEILSWITVYPSNRMPDCYAADNGMFERIFRSIRPIGRPIGLIHRIGITFNYASPEINYVQVVRSDAAHTLTVEAPVSKLEPWHPDYIVTWQTFQDFDASATPLSETWFEQLRSVFALYDAAIDANKQIVLGCVKCMNRSPYTTMLYLMYRGVPIDEAHEATLAHFKLRCQITAQCRLPVEFTAWAQMRDKLLSIASYFKSF
jgi:hypothetical protein